MAYGYTNAVKSLAAAAITPELNNGHLRIYDGARPANADTATSGQTLLAELRFSATAFPAPVNGVATANAITQDSAANNTGTASWFRALKSDGTTAVLDGSVGTSGSDLNLNTTSIVQDGIVQVTSMTITAG